MAFFMTWIMFVFRLKRPIRDPQGTHILCGGRGSSDHLSPEKRQMGMPAPARSHQRADVLHPLRYTSAFAVIYFISMHFFATVCGSYLNGSNIVVGVVSTGEFSEARLQEVWGPTFETYLTESVGRRLDPPRNFSLVLMSIHVAFEMVDEKSIDFIFATPSIFSCLEMENSGKSYSSRYNHF